MAVRMRLMRMGKKKQPMYRVVVVDGRSQRDGRYIEQIGRYEPLHDPSIVEIDNEKAAEWLAKGAQPSETVEKLLNISGAMSTVKVRKGQIHVVGAKTAPAEAPAPVVEAAPPAVEETVEETIEETVEEAVEEAAPAELGVSEEE
jgi:small subunit ribosomal protein S16